jgi:hypothetical protein
LIGCEINFLFLNMTDFFCDGLMFKLAEL